MKFILGKKIEMTQIWRGEEVVAVTKVQAGPCPVVQIKTKEKDGYEAVQIGFGEKKEKNIKKPQKNHFKKLGNFRHVREFRCDEPEKIVKVGDGLDVSTFAVGDIIKVTGTSKGKGFQGVVKRHGFSGSKKTHGNKDQLRMPGSIGSTGPAHVFKGTRMAGRMGGERVTVANLEVVEVDLENNVLFIKGAVPGVRNSLVLIQGQGELKPVELKAQVDENKVEEVKEEIKIEETKVEEEVKAEDKKEEIEK